MRSIWPALLGYALGSFQVIAIDWFRQRAAHRRQLRMLRAELRRLSEYRTAFNWTSDGPANDSVPNPPTITPGYTRLLQEIDFWLTDEHHDDNTQQALINVADGTAVLARYAQAVHDLVAKIESAEGQAAREKLRERAIGNTQAYDAELARWNVMADSALNDVGRRLKTAGVWPQLWRIVRPMPEGSNPDTLPPLRLP